MSMFEEFEDGPEQDIESIAAQFETARQENRQVMFDQDAYDQLIDYYTDKNELERALDVSAVALEQFPYSGSLLLRKAEILFDAKQLHEALDVLALAEVYDPSEMGIYLLRSEILTFQSQYKEAIEVLENVFDAADSEEKSDILLHMADVYEDWQRYDQVFLCLKNCLTADPLNEEALNRINYCVEITMEFEESVRFHEKLIDEQPYSFLAWYNLACAYTGLGMYEKGIDALGYVLAINEEAYFAHHDIADLHFRLKQYDEALQEIKEFHAKADPDEELYFLEGRCHEAKGNLKMARYLYRKAIHIYPGFHEAYYRTAETYRADGSWQQAYNAYERASEIDENDLDYCVGMAEAALELGKIDQAIKAANKAIEVRFNHYAGYFLLARAMSFYHDHNTALEILEKGISVCKDPTPLQYARIAALLLIGKRKQAAVELQQLDDKHAGGLPFVSIYDPSLEDDPIIREQAD